MQGGIPEPVTVFETMRAEADGSIPLLARHLARLQRGCDFAAVPLDQGAVAGALADLPQGMIMRVRLAVDLAGHIRVTHQPLVPNPPFWHVILSGLRLDSSDPWLRVKTSRRAIHDAARVALPEGVDEAILLNERGLPCEGSITNLFLRHGDRLLTPPVSAGLLPGVLREVLLVEGRAEEAEITLADLRSGDLLLGNALRGLIPARWGEDGGAEGG